MASFKAKFPVLQELFAKNHRGGGPFGPPPSGARVNKGKYFSLQGRISRKIDFARGDGKRRPIVQEANFEILNFY